MGWISYRLLYVDGVLISETNTKAILVLKQQFHEAFTIKDLGLAKYFLDLEISRTSEGIFLNQHKYATTILLDSSLTAAKLVKVPLPSSTNLTNNARAELDDPTFYQRIIGRLLYLIVTKPNLSFVVNKFSQFSAKLYVGHLRAAFHVLKYVKGTLSHGFFFHSTNNSFALHGYSDSN